MILYLLRQEGEQGEFDELLQNFRDEPVVGRYDSDDLHSPKDHQNTATDATNRKVLDQSESEEPMRLDEAQERLSGGVTQKDTPMSLSWKFQRYARPLQDEITELRKELKDNKP